MPDPNLGWKIAGWLWDKKDEIAQRLARLYTWFRGKKDDRGILIIGPAGTGKTTLARLLSGDHDWLTSSPWEYSESSILETYSVAGDPTVRLVVPPGQAHRRPSGWADVQSEVEGGKYRGVIFVVSNGFHNLNKSYKHHELYANDKDAFLAAYLAACRQDELRILNELLPALKRCPTKLWVVTLVTKQDLWTADEAAAAEHYTNGPWGRAVLDLAAAKPPKLFRYETLLASLVISNFDTRKDERLKKNSEGYDQKCQVESVRRAFEVLDALRQWEEMA